MFHDEVNYHNKLRCSITIYFLFTLTCKSYYSQKQGAAVACLQLKNIYGEGNAVKSLDHSLDKFPLRACKTIDFRYWEFTATLKN